MDRLATLMHPLKPPNAHFIWAQDIIKFLQPTNLTKTSLFCFWLSEGVKRQTLLCQSWIFAYMGKPIFGILRSVRFCQHQKNQINCPTGSGSHYWAKFGTGPLFSELQISWRRDLYVVAESCGHRWTSDVKICVIYMTSWSKVNRLANCSQSQYTLCRLYQQKNQMVKFWVKTWRIQLIHHFLTGSFI